MIYAGMTCLCICAFIVYIEIHYIIQNATQLTQFGPRREKTCLQRFTNNKGADQPAHSRSLISAFDIRFLERTICKLAAGKIFDFLASLCS